MLDRVKESLFSILEGYEAIHGRVLDLYAGTGALGIECLSRGAEQADFVEQNPAVCRIIRQNLTHTKLHERGTVYCMPVARYIGGNPGKGKTYDIIIMDPPYADPQIDETLYKLATLPLSVVQGVLVLGHSPRFAPQEAYGPYEQLTHRRVGDSCFSIYERVAR
jgi:16S rRNA (guanine(966)-N(2))-methyltransferase RsmD